MKESLSKPFTKQEIQKEIKTGIQNYFRKKQDEELVLFNVEKAENPISREQFENKINKFLENNFDVLVSLVVNQRGGDELNQFKVLNKDLRDFGFGDTSIIVEAILNTSRDYERINKREDGSTDYWSDVPYSDDLTTPYVKEFSYNMLKRHNVRVEYPDIGDKYNKYKKLSEIIATAYLKDHININGKLETDNPKSERVQRYFYKDLNRYLCENDFGMKPYNKEANVSDITLFAETTQRHIRKVISNIETIEVTIMDDHNTDYKELRKKLMVEYQIPERPDYGSPEYNQIYNERNRINKKIEKEIEEKKKEKFSKVLHLPEVKDLIFNAVPYQKFINEVAQKNQDAINEFITNKLKTKTNQDLFKRLEYVQSDEFRKEIISLVFSDIKDFPEIGNGYLIAHSIEHDKPIILWGEEALENITEKICPQIIQMAKDKIIEAYPDERMKKIINNSRDGLSNTGKTEYKPDEISFYYALDKLGIDKFLEIYPEVAIKVFEENRIYENRNLSKFIGGVNDIYKIFGKKIGEMEPDKIKKEIWHDKTLYEAGVWNYFAERSIGMKRPVWDYNNQNQDYAEYEKSENEYNHLSGNFFSNLSQSERRKLFFEGKQMYWLTKQVQRKIWELNRNKNLQMREENVYDSEVNNEFKFYQYHHNINWEQYDCQNIDMDKLSKYLESHGNIICTLLANNNENGQVGSNVNLETIMQVVEAMEAGADMRGVALAYDKKKYLDGILSGQEQKNDMEYALKDWPNKLREAVSLEEFQVYFENAEQYLLQDPNGMIRYAELLQKEPRLRELLGEKIYKKSDLDLRLCLSVQTPEIRGWYFEGAEYVGHTSLQKYLLRFQATRDQSGGGYSNLHDALYWIPNIKHVESGEARALLDDVDTVDESNELKDFLARYNKENDPLKDSGLIKSLRELKKRVFATEANIDLSTLSPELFDIISAPGFNLSALKYLQGEERFKKLIEGEFDKEQPFTPHRRIFTARPLNELLKEGLGSMKEKIRGTAQSPKGLFDSVRKLMQEREVNGRPMQIQDLLNSVPLDMEEEIIKLLQEQRVATGPLLEATVHAKSDPEGWVCGNYTDCCMPFGDSKNTDYMFNKATQYFTVKYNNRIIAQSVIVDSIDNRNQESVIVLDNIEVANNYKNQSAVLSRVYKTFWAEYTSKKVKIGTGNSDLIPDGAKLESNNYSSKYDLSYSDAKGSNIYDLSKIKGVESLDKILTFANLTERDAETIAEMERVAYHEGMVQGKGEVLEVIRKSRELDLPGAASSFILRQGNEPAGYLLVLPEESKLDNSERVAHIYDMVVLPKFQGGPVARKMMERMLDTAKAYNVPAIEFEARDSTSYRLITNPRIAKWIESKGYKLTYNELLHKYLGGEDFHYVRLERVLDEESNFIA